MTKKDAIKVFEDRQVRILWDAEKEKWYISIVAVIAVLTDSSNPTNYWKVLKHRLSKEGSQLVTNCNQLKMQSSDGKYYKTDVADTEIEKNLNLKRVKKLHDNNLLERFPNDFIFKTETGKVKGRVLFHNNTYIHSLFV